MLVHHPSPLASPAERVFAVDADTQRIRHEFKVNPEKVTLPPITHPELLRRQASTGRKCGVSRVLVCDGSYWGLLASFTI